MKIVFTVCLLLIASGASAQAVFKFVDEDGVTHYTDRPPVEDAERLDIYVVRTDQTAVSERQLSERERRALAGTTGESAESSEEQTTEQRNAENRAANCEISRRKQATYADARRIFRVNDAGEREYLNDDEMAAERAQAERDIAEWCD